LQHRVGIDLKHPSSASDAQALGQARDDSYEEVRRCPLAVKDGAESGLEQSAVPSGPFLYSPRCHRT
jgi:hypothetical protein